MTEAALQLETDPDWERVVAEVNKRYAEIGSPPIHALAQKSGVADRTWSRLLDGMKVSQRRTINNIEKGLGWGHGSIQSILTGGEATIIEDADSEATLATLLTEVRKLRREIAALSQQVQNIQ